MLPVDSNPVGLREAVEDPRETVWRAELERRLQSYRARKRKLSPNLAQTQFSFDGALPPSPGEPPVAVDEARGDDDFSFTIAIGRNRATHEDPRMFIDLSLPPDAQSLAPSSPSESRLETSSLCPVAPIEERRRAGLADALCLLFAYGGFLALFGSLGGQFTFSKLSAAMCITTFAIVYLQYFALFTVFGGTTPGMMLRGLQVVDFSGETPSPRQMLWRSFGYMLSAGTFFLGFLWALWDEDGLTWHDRLSHTYLSPVHSFVGADEGSAVHNH